MRSANESPLDGAALDVLPRRPPDDPANEVIWCSWDPTTDVVILSPAVPPVWLGITTTPTRSRDLRALVGPAMDETLLEFMLAVASDPSQTANEVLTNVPSRLAGTRLHIHAARLGPAGSTVMMVFSRVGDNDRRGSSERNEIRRLRHQVDELSQQNHHLSQYVSVIAHDLRAPLQSMNNLLDQVLSHFGSSMPLEAARVLELVNQTAGQSARLTRDVLAHARLGRDSMSSTEVDLVELAYELWPGMQPADASLHLPSEALVRGDAPLLRRLIGTLLDNSIKYRADRPLFVAIRCERRASEWCVSIEDNGRGIPAGRHQECFELFRRHDSQVDGTGMGLAIARRIVELHGGEIWAEARTPHLGTRITFTLQIPSPPPSGQA
jgi:signal transduction histidine kinase